MMSFNTAVTTPLHLCPIVCVNKCLWAEIVMLAQHKGIFLHVGQAREDCQSSVKDKEGKITTQHMSGCLASTIHHTSL